MNQTEEIFADLKSKDPSIRFIALNKVEETTLDDWQLEHFKALVKHETEPGLLFQINKILAKTTLKEKATPEKIIELLQNPHRDDVQLAMLLSSIKRSQAPLVTIALRDYSWASMPEQLLPTILKFIKKHGSYEDVAELEVLCRHHDPKVLVSALEALEKINPESLKSLIVPLLRSSNFAVRSKAVLILHRWDSQEALRHFEAMLFSNESIERQIALFQAFFFPFDNIISFLLKFISIEADLELIKRVGLLFMTNPKLQVLPKLVEIREASIGNKFKLINQIIKGIINSLHQIGLIETSPADALLMLERRLAEKKIHFLIRKCVTGLKSEDSEIKLKSALNLCKLTKYQIKEVDQVITKYLEIEKDENIREKVRSYYFSLTKSQPVKAVDLANFTDLSPETRLECIISVDKESFKTVFEQGTLIFNKLTLQEQVSLINATLQFGSKNETPFLISQLENKNHEILSATIDAITAIEPDILHPYLPQFLKHPCEEVRLTALKVFALFDKKQAISLLEKMLFALKPAQRRHAIFCLGHFDFHSVCNILLAALKVEKDEENLQQIANIFRLNPSEEIFYQLHLDGKLNEAQTIYDSLCQEIATSIAASDNALPVRTLYENARKQYRIHLKDREKKKIYDLETIQNLRKIEEQAPIFDGPFIRFIILSYAIGAFLTALIWFFVLAPK